MVDNCDLPHTDRGSALDFVRALWNTEDCLGANLYKQMLDEMREAPASAYYDSYQGYEFIGDMQPNSYAYVCWTQYASLTGLNE
jgi:hypothetical protein